MSTNKSPRVGANKLREGRARLGTNKLPRVNTNKLPRVNTNKLPRVSTNKFKDN